MGEVGYRWIRAPAEWPEARDCSVAWRFRLGLAWRRDRRASAWSTGWCGMTWVGRWAGICWASAHETASSDAASTAAAVIASSARRDVSHPANVQAVSETPPNSRLAIGPRAGHSDGMLRSGFTLCSKSLAGFSDPSGYSAFLTHLANASRFVQSVQSRADLGSALFTVARITWRGYILATVFVAIFSRQRTSASQVSPPHR